MDNEEELAGKGKKKKKNKKKKKKKKKEEQSEPNNAEDKEKEEETKEQTEKTKLPTEAVLITRRVSARLKGVPGQPFPVTPQGPRRATTAQLTGNTADSTSPSHQPEADAPNINAITQLNTQLIQTDHDRERALFGLLQAALPHDAKEEFSDQDGEGEDYSSDSTSPYMDAPSPPGSPGSPDIGEASGTEDSIGSAGILTQPPPTKQPTTLPAGQPSIANMFQKLPTRGHGQGAPPPPTTPTTKPTTNRGFKDLAQQLAKTPAPAPNLTKGTSPSRAASVPKKKRSPLVSFMQALGGAIDEPETDTPQPSTTQHSRLNHITPPAAPSFL